MEVLMQNKLEGGVGGEDRRQRQRWWGYKKRNFTLTIVYSSFERRLRCYEEGRGRGRGRGEGGKESQGFSVRTLSQTVVNYYRLLVAASVLLRISYSLQQQVTQCKDSAENSIYCQDTHHRQHHHIPVLVPVLLSSVFFHYLFQFSTKCGTSYNYTLLGILRRVCIILLLSALQPIYHNKCFLFPPPPPPKFCATKSKKNRPKSKRRKEVNEFLEKKRKEKKRKRKYIHKKFKVREQSGRSQVKSRNGILDDRMQGTSMMKPC